jgi:hypothetical protein
MATYGYSTPYTGRGDTGPLPPGFMDAATAPGRNLAMGIAAMGQGLGKAIEQYRTKKAETEAATQSWETVSGLMQQQLSSDPKYLAIQQYMETGALPQGVSEQDIPRYTQQVQADREMLNKFSALGEKFPDMSLAKKKAALGDAVMVLNQYRTDQQNQVREAAARQQLRLVELQLQEAQDKRRQNEILTNAIRYGLEQPTTTTQTQQVTETIEFPPMPGVPTTAVQATPSQAEATAARYFMGQYGQAAQQLQQYGAGLGRQANALNVSPTQQVSYPPVFPFPGRPAATVESPIQAAARAEANTRLREQQLAESQAALQQAGIMSRSPALQTIAPRTLQPAQQTAPMQQPPETRTRNVSTEVPISYEDQSKRLMQFLVQQGARPETLSMVPQILSMVGQQRPTRVEQVGNLGSVIRFGDKEQFVPNPKTDIGDILKVRGLTIKSPEFRGQAPTEAEAKDFREQYSNVLDSRRSIKRLIEIAQMGKAQQQTPEIKAEAEQLAIGAQGALRLEILGPGTVTEPDREILKSIVPNPTRIFSLQSSNLKALKSLLERAGNGIETKAKALGLEVLKPQQQAAAPVSGGVLRWNTVTQKLE